MQISSNHSLAILAGYPRQDQPCQGQTCKSEQTQIKTVSETPQSVSTADNPQSVRPTARAQPMFDQALSYRGEQARRTYQNVESEIDVEVMQRLDVRV
jgi:hypothetical protein